MKLSYLIRGLPGHPLHPPLTDATIGAYTAATVMGFASIIGVAEKGAASGWWLALIVGLIFTVPTALSGFADWLTIEWGSPLWRTTTWHAVVMACASVFFILAILVGHKHYSHGLVGTWPFILTAFGWCALTVGGWLGGAVVFVHGMRVLSLVDEPAARAAAPVPTPEKEAAEGA